MKKRLLPSLFVLTTLFAAALFADSASKAEKMLELIESAPVKKIKSYIIKNKTLADAKYGEKNNSLLMEAIEKGRDYDVIKLLLDAGVNPKLKNDDGDTALTLAAKKQVDKKTFDALISYDTVLSFQRKNRILQKNKEGKSAMDYAKENGDAENISVINHYLGIVDVAESEPKAEEPEKAEEPKEEAPQEISVAQELAEPLIAAAAGISAPENTAALQEAAAAAAQRAANPYKRIYLFDGIEAYDTYSEPAEKKVELIADPDKRGAYGRTLLQKAAAEDDIQKITLLKESGATVNLADAEGYTALMYAARFAKKVETVALLLSFGADAKLQNRFGLTALEIAAADNKNPEIVAALLAKTPKAAAQKAYITAVGLGRPNATLQKFLDCGMSANAYYKGKSVLMYAAESNTHTDCIKFLMEKGADKTMLSSDWKDAFHYASNNPSLPKNDVYWSLNNSEKKR